MTAISTYSDEDPFFGEEDVADDETLSPASPPSAGGGSPIHVARAVTIERHYSVRRSSTILGQNAFLPKGERATHVNTNRPLSKTPSQSAFLGKRDENEDNTVRPLPPAPNHVGANPFLSEEEVEDARGETPPSDARSENNVSPASNIEPSKKHTPNPWKTLFTFMTKRQALALVVATILAIISGCLIPGLAYILGQVLNDFSKFGSGDADITAVMSDIMVKVYILLVLAGAVWSCSWLFFSAWVSFGEMQAKSARMALYSAMLVKEITWYDEQTAGSGAVIARFQSQIRELEIATSQPLGLCVQHTATVLAALGLAFWKCWDLTLVTIACVPVGLPVLAFISARMQPAIERHMAHLTAAANQIKSAVEAIEVVKCFNAQVGEESKYRNIVKESGRCYLGVARLNSLQVAFVRLVTRTLFVAGFWYGSHVVASGRRTPGDILTAFWGCLMATQTFEQILPQLVVLERGRAAAARLRHFVAGADARIEHFEKQGIIPRHLDGDIELNNVSFTYPSQPDRKSLENVTLFFPAHETVWMVGRSGSGKSTIATLLARFYDKWEGHIWLDNSRLQDLNLQWLRKNITIVQQDSVLLHDTIRRNLALSRGHEHDISAADEEDIMERFCLQQIISELPNGLETVVGSGGTQLSGGQTQRVALARAYLRNTPVLVLDEVTSALDKSTAQHVMASILEWRRGKSTVIISHDLEPIRPEDFVYVLDQGRLVEQGYRSVLESKKDGPFVQLVRSTGAELRSPKMPVSPELPQVEQDIKVSQPRGHRYTFSQATTAYEPLQSPPMSPVKKQPTTPEKAHFRDRFISNSERPHSMISVLTDSRFSGMPEIMMPRSAKYRETSVFGSFPASPVTEEEIGDNDGISSPKIVTSYPQSPKSLLNSPKSVNVEMQLLPKRPEPPPKYSRKKTAQAQVPLSLQKVLSTVWPHLSPKMRVVLILGFIAAAIHATCTPVFSFVFARLLTTYYTPGNKSQDALQWSLILIAVAVVDSISSFITQYLLYSCGEAWVADIRAEAWKRMLDQPMSWFESTEASTSQILDLLDRGAEEMKNILGKFAGMIFVAVFMAVVGLVWCSIESWQLTAVGIACAPIMYVVTFLFDKVTMIWEGRSNRAAQVVATIFLETAEKIKTIHSFTLEEVFSKKLKIAAHDAQSIGNRRAIYAGFFFGAADSTIIFVTAVVFFYGAILLSHGKYQVTNITTVFAMLLFVTSNINSLTGFMPQLSQSRQTATSLLKLTQISSLDVHEYLDDTHLTDGQFRGAIRFRDVCFSYPSRPGNLALRYLNLDIPLHTSTALVGSSGSGKSTVMALILRLYSLHNTDSNTSRFPTFAHHLSPGSLKIGDQHRLNGGIPLSQLDVRRWRDLVAYVPQHSKLFPGTIAQNIAYGLDPSHPLNTPHHISEAAARAGIHDFITSLPQSYETVVGDGGMGLSGGQRQKMGIARALLRQPKLLVMDEPTSALDATSASQIRALIRRLSGAEASERGRGLDLRATTVVVITHDVEMMKACRRLCVMREGRAVAQGSFEELLRSGRNELGDILGLRKEYRGKGNGESGKGKKMLDVFEEVEDGERGSQD